MKTLRKVLLAVLCVVIATCFAACGGAGGSRVSVSDDGHLIIDGVQTDFAAENGKSAYEQYCEAHPEYEGDEATWLSDLAAGRLAEEHDYTVISYGRTAAASLQKGTMTAANASLSFTEATLALHNPIVLPFGEGASWHITLKAELKAAGQILTSFGDGNDGRFYLATNGTDKMYVGMSIADKYANYYWTVNPLVFKHMTTFDVYYENGEFLLSVDGDQKRGIEKVNVNHSGDAEVITSAKASAELVNEVHAVNGQEYATLTHIGATSNTHGVDGDFRYLAVHTSSTYGYKQILEHPLANKTIYYLGSSITVGIVGADHNSFAHLTTKLTGCAMELEAVSGTWLAKSDKRNDSYVERLDKLDITKQPDALVVQLSTNDFQNNVTAGTVGNGTSSSSFDKSTITGAIEYIVAKVHEVSPDTKIIMYACPLQTNFSHYTQYGNYVNTTLKTLASKWEGVLSVLDLYNAEYVKVSTYMQGDGFHPEVAGYAHIFVPRFVNLLMEILPTA